MLKPSELTPASASLLAELIPKYLDPELVRVVNGGVPETTKARALYFIRAGVQEPTWQFPTLADIHRPQILELPFNHS